MTVRRGEVELGQSLGGGAASRARRGSPGATFPWDELRALLPSLRPQIAVPQNPASQDPAPQNH